MMYVVMFFEEYEGYFADEYMRVFANKGKAEEYANELNEKLANYFKCKAIELGDYYAVIEMQCGD